MFPKKRVTNFLRAAILLLIFPAMYLSLWISISGNEALIYAEQVARLKSYLPEFAHNLRLNIFICLGMCSVSAILSFHAWRHSESQKMLNFSMIICAIATVLSAWFLIGLL